MRTRKKLLIGGLGAFCKLVLNADNNGDLLGFLFSETHHFFLVFTIILSPVL